MEGSLFLARPIKITMSGIEIKKEKSNEIEKQQQNSLSFVCLSKRIVNMI